LSDESGLSEAIVTYLRHYPGKNDAEFDARYGPVRTTAMQARVRDILEEAMTTEPDWRRLSLQHAGDLVESEIRRRHPGLSPEALRSIGNYYTYLMR